ESLHGRRGVVMSSPKRQILEVVRDEQFPLTKSELVTILGTAGLDQEVVMVASLLDDTEFTDEDELEHRLDEAMGMPDAFTDLSALEHDTAWPHARGA
ncbi:MAG TPA: hypothetical protein VF183_15340, partial [Acidimicrobiales bacterium]